MNPLAAALFQFLPYVLLFVVGYLVPRRQGTPERIAIGIVAALSLLVVKSLWPSATAPIPDENAKEWPYLLTVIVFSVALTMHEFVYALAFVTSSSQKTISIGVTTELIRGDVFFWQSLMAAAVIVAIPVAFLYNIFLDRFIAGFTLGAVKG